jgi:hypothetical protein
MHPLMHRDRAQFPIHNRQGDSSIPDRHIAFHVSLFYSVQPKNIIILLTLPVRKLKGIYIYSLNPIKEGKDRRGGFV